MSTLCVRTYNNVCLSVCLQGETGQQGPKGNDGLPGVPVSYTIYCVLIDSHFCLYCRELEGRRERKVTRETEERG